MSADLEKVNVAEVMQRIRLQAKDELAKNPQNKRFIVPLSSRQMLNPGEPLITSEELRYLNEHWHDWNSPAEICSHRKIIGPIVVRVKKFIADIIWNSFLRGYIERERQFQMHLVRFLNQTSRYIDEKDRAHFVDIASKVDSDISSTNERMDLLYNEVLASAHQIESNIFKAKQQNNR